MFEHPTPITFAIAVDDGYGESRAVTAVASGLRERGIAAAVPVVSDPGGFEAYGDGLLVTVAHPELTEWAAARRYADEQSRWWVWVHSWGPSGDVSTLSAREANEMAQADVVVTLSEAHKENILRQVPIDRARVVTVPNGVDIPSRERLAELRRTMRDEILEDEGDCLVCMAARHGGYKRQDVAIRALARTRASARIVLVLPGDGPELEQHRALASQLGVATRVLFPGYVDPTLPWFAAADVGLVLSGHEVQPLSLLEMAACSCPLVSNDIGDAGSIVQDSETGLLLRHAEPPDVAKAMIALATRPEARVRMGEAARSNASEHYSIDATLAGWERLLSGVGETAV